MFLMGCSFTFYGQNIALSEFEMSNSTSPAFQLLEETVTDVYTPENVKALALHVQNNFGESMAIELAPYFFINTKSKNRTYQKYTGVTKVSGPVGGDSIYKQNPFSGLNTTTVSFAYLKKDFENIAGDDPYKTFSLGARTTLLRFFNKEKMHHNTENITRVLRSLDSPPLSILTMPEGSEKEEALKKFYIDQQKIDQRFKPFQKTIKPVFKLDGAVAYSNLFKGNSLDGGTMSRFGSWLTAEFSLILNQDDENSPANNYLNLLFVARYVEDGFNREATGDFTTNYYRDFGGKINAELGRFTLGYEYIKRHGSISSERSVGSLSFLLDKNISITGGFGKDFQLENNLLAIFGINWGFNFGESSVAIDN